MVRILSDKEISDLLHEPKPLPSNWSTRLRPIPKSKMTYDQRNYEMELPSRRRFSLILRRNRQSPVDFSVVLAYIDNDGNDYILRRHNGAHPSRHTNQWEKMQGRPNFQLPICFHVHQATERYQESGLEIDGFAERTERYNDFEGALTAMFQDAGFIFPDGGAPQLPLPIQGA